MVESRGRKGEEMKNRSKWLLTHVGNGGRLRVDKEER
jgi:hypothetical protein